MIGHTFARFIEDAKIASGRRTPEIAGPSGRTLKNRATIRMLMQIVVSVLVLGGAYSILADTQADTSTRETAAGFAGSVIGYWIR